MSFLFRKGNKKNRNILTGIIVGIAAIIAIAVYVDVPKAEIFNFMLSTALFVLAIMLLAIITIAMIKLLGSLWKLISSHSRHHSSESDKE